MKLKQGKNDIGKIPNETQVLVNILILFVEIHDQVTFSHIFC